MLEPCLESALISPCLRATRLHTNRLWRHGVQPSDQISTTRKLSDCFMRGHEQHDRYSPNMHMGLKDKSLFNLCECWHWSTPIWPSTVYLFGKVTYSICSISPSFKWKIRLQQSHLTKKNQFTNPRKGKWETDVREGTPRGIQRQTGRDLERAAGMVKDVLCWETPGESYAEALGLSSIVDCWDKSLWQLGAKPELQNMPLLATA